MKVIAPLEIIEELRRWKLKKKLNSVKYRTLNGIDGVRK